MNRSAQSLFIAYGLAAFLCSTQARASITSCDETTIRNAVAARSAIFGVNCSITLTQGPLQIPPNLEGLFFIPIQTVINGNGFAVTISGGNNQGVKIFELGEVAKVLAMPLTKVKNWTIGRPLEIKPSIKTASGHGSRNLFSLEDVYLIGLANELSKAGMAAKAIGKLIEAGRAKFPSGLGGVATLFVSRGPKLGYRIETREDRVPGDAVVTITIAVSTLRTRIDSEVRRLR